MLLKFIVKYLDVVLVKWYNDDDDIVKWYNDDDDISRWKTK